MNRVAKIFFFLAATLLVGVVFLALYLGPLSVLAPPTLCNDTAVWLFHAPEQIISVPVVGAGTAYVRTAKSVYALNVADGKTIWYADLPGQTEDTHPPKLFGDFLVVPEEPNGGIAVFSAKNGELLWHASANYSAPIDSMTYSNETLVVARYSEYITAYDANNGQIRWRINVPGRGYTEVLAHDMTLYTGMYDLFANDLLSGKLIWSEKPTTSPGRMALDDNILYMTLGYGENTTVAAFGTEKREFIWKTPIPYSGPLANMYLALDEHTLYVAGDVLTAISIEDGGILWQSDPIRWPKRPVVLNNTVYVMSQDTRLLSNNSLLQAYNKSNGNRVGTWSLSSQVGSSPYAELNLSVAGDLLLVPVSSHILCAYRP